jgi:hypothetical protein
MIRTSFVSLTVGLGARDSGRTVADIVAPFPILENNCNEVDFLFLIL